MDFHFGAVAGTRYDQLEGTYVAAKSGLYTLHIENTSTLASSSLLYNYIDNICIKPVVPNLDIEDINVPCQTGKTVTLNLKAGLTNGGKPYWVWMSATGTYPGFPLNGLTVPLNWDILFQFGLFNPGFPGSSNFVGKLDFFGLGKAQLTLPPDPQQTLVGIPIYFAYVLTAPGPSLPISYVSTPVHIKYVP